jgi:isoleucyl-tRNA synthetase
MNMKEKRFKEISSPGNVPAAEERILELWERERTFEKSVAARTGAKDFVFYEGPPTANGLPGVHHVMARLCKDVVCRYKTMRGYRVIRKGGWDTHGLPVEIEVENKLGLTSKEQIEAIGIGEFNARCRESVFAYEKEWGKFTQRIGYWLDMEHPYVTCANEYIESVWWILKEFWKNGLLYEGHKIVPYCPRCGTSLSSHEVSQGYKDVSDPSIFVKFKAAGTDEFFLVWTTTPWTLISNAALAVGPDFDYVTILANGERLVLAKERLGVIDGEYEVLETRKGRDLLGRAYEPLFPYFLGTEGAFLVRAGDFVSLEDGTGIVHIAPAFGEDDYKMHLAFGVPLLQPVTPTGVFADEILQWAGKEIKKADPSIINDLKERGLLYKSSTVTHSYPFCWRCSKALIYYARRSWYIKTTAIKDQLLEANRSVDWIPREVGESRFGNWLENNVDWALSRERYWGTPLNIWICGECGANHAVGSIKELEELSGNFPAGKTLDLHKPAVDELVLACPSCGGGMKRVKEVIDCWFDSGSMPFSQYHYPIDEENMFEGQFPADFICEGVDQSRGWFYSLLVISTFLKGRSAYKSVLTTGMILDKNGQKMSKSRGNAVEPWDVLNKEGADALRWYLLTTSPPWMPTRFDRHGVVEAGQKLLGTLRNVYSFFGMYAEIDDFRIGADRGTPNLLDRWLLSRYATISAKTAELMDSYDITRAARLLHSFVLDELSNWYVRRSRRRFWKGEMGPDKVAAYSTLYTVFRGVINLLAPFVPFLAEEIHQHLRHAAVEPESNIAESVHLATFPAGRPELVDADLEELMDLAIRVSSLGRTVRNDAGIKIRQPLGEIIIHDSLGRAHKLKAREEIAGLVADELHVKRLSVAEDLAEYVTFAPRLNYPVLGKRFGKRVPEIVSEVKSLSQADLASFKRSGEIRVGDVALTAEDVAVTVEGMGRYGACEERGITVILNLEITDELKMEGLAREIVNRLQNLRKQAGFHVTDRIAVRYEGGGLLDSVFDRQGDFVREETLATAVERGPADWTDRVSLDLEEAPGTIWIRKEN